ncbi:restriction modification system DNA specificity domain protein [Microcystis aeruginosa NIES-3806]|uniref:restriction endonuclease subunit S n=1 Tax=Microcystis aeruginosa TaxID=1126 RepID=UPI001307957C|nr:restriction endonuclease subunit S [Microcystis aeruginosa]GCL52716.1 restriction modification system DNA specificity domain protein [Microcystis aeruginosa NIES-3806]
MMTKKWQPYPTYKDSGVEWLGAIPEHWENWKISHAFQKIGSGTTPSTNRYDYYDGDVPWINTSELRENIITDTSVKITNKALLDNSVLNLYSPGTLLIAMYGATIGRLGILGITACTNQACCALANPILLDTKFVFYWLWMRRNELIILSSGGGQPNINQEKIRSIKIPAPPLPEQQKIAQFLDQETSKIDKLITKKERLIKLLKEKRTALISHAVTKGLNPDVPMKDSGVEWLGKIPEHWKVKRLKFLTRQIIDGTHFTPTYAVEGVPFLRVTDIQESVINFEQVKLIPESEHKELIKRCNPEKGDLLLSKNGTIGVPRIVDWNHKFSIFVSLCLIKVRKLLSVHYSYYFFLSHEIKSQMSYGTKTNTVMNLHLDKIREFIFTFPPLPEQQKIAQFLDRETGKIDNLITKTRTSIDHLKEYRTALISAAVTGKIDVREH